ncbi:MAG: DinB family protein [bacterium]|nr:DinB family protein [bacterium]
MVKWFEKKFPQRVDSKTLPALIERLSSIPNRLEEVLKSLPPERCTKKTESKWSIQENVGHLPDVEPIWLGRFDDIVAGKEFLGTADLTNKKTECANHNAVPLETILIEFERLRIELVKKLSNLKTEDLEKSSLHPRLKVPMRIADLAYFIAEHDEHHLGLISCLAK